MTSNQNLDGHGHVYPRADGFKARCGGPAMCAVCAREQTRKNAEQPSSKPRLTDMDLRMLIHAYEANPALPLFRNEVLLGLYELSNRRASTPPKTIHGHDCWSWGPQHYQCAMDYIIRLHVPPPDSAPNEMAIQRMARAICNAWALSPGCVADESGKSPCTAKNCSIYTVATHALQELGELPPDEPQSDALLHEIYNDMLDVLASGRPTGSTDLLADRLMARLSPTKPERSLTLGGLVLQTARGDTKERTLSAEETAQMARARAATEKPDDSGDAIAMDGIACTPAYAIGLSNETSPAHEHIFERMPDTPVGYACECGESPPIGWYPESEGDSRG